MKKHERKCPQHRLDTLGTSADQDADDRGHGDRQQAARTCHDLDSVGQEGCEARKWCRMVQEGRVGLLHKSVPDGCGLGDDQWRQNKEGRSYHDRQKPKSCSPGQSRTEHGNCQEG